MIKETFDVIVPSSRIMRQLKKLYILKKSFNGKIRLIVNEGCLPGCPYRIQHFYEMGNEVPYPKTLCQSIFKEKPWLRLTGSWVLPQHIHFYDGYYDELKLSGRVTLQNKDIYKNVLYSYIFRKELFPQQIGGGPACIHIKEFPITEQFYKYTLYCNHKCHSCTYCQDYFSEKINLMKPD